MLHKNIILIAVITVLFVIFCASCGSGGNKEAGSSPSALSEKQASDSSMKSAAESASGSNAKIDLKARSSELGTSPGRLALAIIIDRLDNATVVEDLSKKNAQELFDLLRQTASQKSQTLEGLNSLYHLNDILASEGIYVTIQANNVTSAASCSVSDSWIDVFETSLMKSS